jgi:hypothetical protein
MSIATPDSFPASSESAIANGSNRCRQKSNETLFVAKLKRHPSKKTNKKQIVTPFHSFFLAGSYANRDSSLDYATFVTSRTLRLGPLSRREEQKLATKSEIRKKCTV